MTWTLLTSKDMCKKIKDKKFFYMLKKKSIFSTWIFSNCSNSPPEKKQSPTQILLETQKCSKHQHWNDKQQSPTPLKVFLWFLAKIFFYYRQHHKYSNHQPTYDFLHQITAITHSKKLSSTHLLMHLIRNLHYSKQ